MKQGKTNTMKAVAIDRFGGPETLTLETLPAPEVGPDEVLIRVDSADVAVWDPFEREGGFAKLYGIKPGFPHVLGVEPALRIHESDAVDAVAFLEATDALPYGRDRARAIGAECVGKPRLNAA